jgi:hypothetical protein
MPTSKVRLAYKPTSLPKPDGAGVKAPCASGLTRISRPCILMIVGAARGPADGAGFARALLNWLAAQLKRYSA